MANTKKNGGKGGSPYKEEKGYDKGWPPPAPQKPKLAKKNKKTKALTEKSDKPYGQPEKAHKHQVNNVNA